MEHRFLMTPASAASAALFVFTLALTACDEDYPAEPGGSTDSLLVNPSIDTVVVTLDADTDIFFLRAKIVDPQGIENIDSVSLEGFQPERTFPAVRQRMYDDGTHYDQIAGDGWFSARLNPSFAQYRTGTFRFVIGATDSSGNVAVDWEETFDTNLPPSIELYSVTTQVTLGDTITLEVLASDPNGLQDIRSVTYDVKRPDGTITSDPSFVMRDDGAFGDRNANDGIYTVKNPTDPGGKTGLFTFLVIAEDRQGALSDTLEAEVELVP